MSLAKIGEADLRRRIDELSSKVQTFIFTDAFKSVLKRQRKKPKVHNTDNDKRNLKKTDTP